MMQTEVQKVGSRSLAVNKEVFIGWISSAVEAYNMAIYSFIAPILGLHIFRSSSQFDAVLFSYCLVFLGSCFLYPLGAVYFGTMGDREGRQKICVYSTLGLALTTGLMGIIPFDFFEYTWICFLALVCGQHFFSGGEYYGSIVFSLEHSEAQEKGFMSSLSCLFAVLGILAANGFATYAHLKQEELWIRICFLMGAVGGILSYILKRYCSETPVYTALAELSVEQEDWWSFVKSEWRNIVIVIGVFGFFLVAYTFIFFVLPLLNQDTLLSFDTFESLILYGFFLVISGFFADKIGTERLMTAGFCLFSFALLPLCYFCKNLFVVQIILTLSACMVIGPIHSWMINQFDIRQRCRGIFVSSAISISIFGGSTIPICLLLYENFNSLLICCLYPLVISVGALSCLNFFDQKKSKWEKNS